MKKESQAGTKDEQQTAADFSTSASVEASPMLSVRSSSTPKGWDCKGCGKNCYADMKDYYMLKDDLWAKLHPKLKGMLCMHCVEEKLGRKLQKQDILICRLTTDINPYTRSILNDR